MLFWGVVIIVAVVAFVLLFFVCVSPLCLVFFFFFSCGIRVVPVAGVLSFCQLREHDKFLRFCHNNKPSFGWLRHFSGMWKARAENAEREKLIKSAATAAAAVGKLRNFYGQTTRSIKTQRKKGVRTGERGWVFGANVKSAQIAQVQGRISEKVVKRALMQREFSRSPYQQITGFCVIHGNATIPFTSDILKSF